MSLTCEVWAVKLPAEPERDEVYERCKAVSNERDALRSDRYVRRDDKLRAIVNRLLPRAVLATPPFCIPFSTSHFTTTARGRPSLAPPHDFSHTFDFNCTHDHDWVCIGFLHSSEPSSPATMSARIGVDVMRLAMPFPNCDLAELRTTLADQLAPSEMADVRSLPQHSQVRQLLRYWAHKEALVKATGTGIGAGLSQYVFDLRALDAPSEIKDNRTTVEIYDEYQPGWRFYETMLDDLSLFVAAIHLPGFPVTAVPDLEPTVHHKTIDDILALAAPAQSGR